MLSVVTCIHTISMSSCVRVKQLLVDNPSFDNLNKIQTMFAQFANKTYSLQSQMHDRIDYLEDLNTDKPTLCADKRMTDGVASVTRTIDIMLPKVLTKLRASYGKIKRFRPSGTYGILHEIPDYSEEIRDLSNKIIEAIKTNAQESMAKMGFIVKDLLPKQVNIEIYCIISFISS